MADKPLIHPTIDINGFFPFRLDTVNGTRQLVVDLSRGTQPLFFSHMQELAWLEINGKKLDPVPVAGTPAPHNTVRFNLPPEMKEGDQLTLGLGKQGVSNVQPIAQATFKNGALEPTANHPLYQMCVSETRTLGLPLRRSEHAATNSLAFIPYDRKKRVGYQNALHSPLTDLHTHATGQILGSHLLEAALEVDKLGAPPVGYPLELLEKLKLKLEPGQQAIEVDSYEFTPLKDEGLACEQRGKCKAVRISQLTPRQLQVIGDKMGVAPDRTMMFSEFDRHVYRYRNPLAKNPALTKAVLKKIAAEYKEQGIEYAELSTASMLDPSWFKAMTEAVEEIEKEGGPRIRFLIGLPRSLSPQRMMIMLDKSKYLMRHPYIVGVDLLGYEFNKTSTFHWALSNLAQWTETAHTNKLKPDQGWNFKRDFVLRVHAGETNKNPENVDEAIHVADEYGIRLRVAHALTAKMPDGGAVLNDIRKLAKKEDEQGTIGSDITPRDLFAFEMCPDSNQAYMTMPLVRNSPIALRSKQAPIVLGSDGGGSLLTSARQLAFSALEAGLSLDKLKEMRMRERGYIDRQRRRESIKKTAFDKLYTGGLDDFLGRYKKHVAVIPESSPQALSQFLPKQFRHKQPIMILGASGSNWNTLDHLEQEKIEKMMHLLVQCFDPTKVYFVLGRVQNEGVGKALDIAVKRYNRAHPKETFAVLGRMAGTSTPTGELPETTSWVQEIPGGIDAVPGSMLQFTRTQNGRIMAFGGSDFTAEIMHGAQRGSPIPSALFVTKNKKINEVAQVIPSHRQYQSMEELADKVLQKVGADHFFRTDQERSSLLRNHLDMAKAQRAALEAWNAENRDQKVRRGAQGYIR